MRIFVRCAVLALAMCVAVGAQAQAEITPPRDAGGWTKVRISKWALLGLAIGMGGYTIAQKHRADDLYDDLRARCSADPDRCVMEGSSYADPESETLFDRASSADRRAQFGMIGAQVTLLGSAALFVYDLRNGSGPADIPYPPARSGYVIGLSLAF